MSLTDENCRWVAVASDADLAEGEMLGVDAGGHEIALYRLAGGDICATSNVCTHGLAYLSEGWLSEDGTVECPLHAGCFDVRTGKGKGPPIEEDLRTYRVRSEDGVILIGIPD